MIHIVNRDLRSVLTGLAKVVSSKASLEVLRCIRVDASPDRVTLTGTDLNLTASVELSEADTESTASFLIPFETLQSMTRRLPSRSLVHLEAGSIHGELGSGTVTENITPPDISDFPADTKFKAAAQQLPETFHLRFLEALACSSSDESRYILNGVALEVTAADGGHYLVGTDGRHLFSANSFTLPLKESLVVPNHKLLAWRGLPDSWALACEKIGDRKVIRFEAGIWTLTLSSIDGNYPNWRQVLVRDEQVTTRVTFPKEHAYGEIIQALPGSDRENKPVDLVVADGVVSVKDSLGGAPLELVDVRSSGPDVSVRLNRDYLNKAFSFGLNSVGVVDSISPLRFTNEGRTLIVMPLHLERRPVTNPAPAEPQSERKETMPETTEHTNGASRSVVPSPETKPALEAAIDKLDAFKSQFKEALVGLNDLTTLLRQVVREQKSGEKEINNVRQTLRSLQSVKI